MKQHLTCLLLMLVVFEAVAQSPPVGASAGINPLADPFQANAKVELPPPPSPMKHSAVPLPPVPPPPVASPTSAPLPPGLRVVLIRDNGQGLLGTADAGAFSIPVANGKMLRLGGQDYAAEVSATEIRLYATPKGKLLWQGTLGGPAMVSAPVDISQAKYIPPLSAGVSPGLKPGGTGSVSPLQ
jgi:hypothetical protein